MTELTTEVRQTSERLKEILMLALDNYQVALHIAKGHQPQNKIWTDFVEFANSLGLKLFETRDDSRYLVMDFPWEEGKIRTLTLYAHPVTGLIDIDLTPSGKFDPEVEMGIMCLVVKIVNQVINFSLKSELVSVTEYKIKMLKTVEHLRDSVSKIKDVNAREVKLRKMPLARLSG